MTDTDDPVRGGDGKYVRTLTGAERDAEAARLRSRGHSYREIGEALGCDKGTAHHAVQRAMQAVIQEPGEAAVQWSIRRLDEERVRLHEVRDLLEGILAREHVTVSQGHVVYTDDGGTVPDDEFILKTVDRLLRVDEQLRRNDESMRKLLGTDQPVKTQVSGGVTYEIVGIDPEALR